MGLQRKHFGFALDAVMIVTAVVLLSAHPGFTLLQSGGLASAAKEIVVAGESLPPAPHKFNVKAEFRGAFEYVFGSYLGPRSDADPRLREFVSVNAWKTSLFLPASVQAALPHTVATWLRNYVAAMLVYFGAGGVWAVWLYYVRREQYFPGGVDLPSWGAVRDQMLVSCRAMPLYVLMPTWGEWLIERGWTLAYSSWSEVGGFPQYVLWTLAYGVFFEWGIYWIHRILHVPVLYRALHRPHHIYNKAGSLSPFAGLAFDPFDGMLQASPYLIGLFLVPVHFWTHEILLFFTGVWTTNIHDTLTVDTEPMMGSKYHTYHHTAFKDNYGQLFVFWDWVHETLTDPNQKKKQKAAAEQAAQAKGTKAN